MNWTPLPGDRAAIDDRRAQNPVVAPSPADSLVRGLPQTPHELELYRQKLARDAAFRAGQPLPVPQQSDALPGLVVDQKPSKGDPAGLEARRAHILARMQADQAALAEIELRLGAVNKEKAPKR